jgi:hypothetical protein
MYAELKAAFPTFSHYYQVVGLPISDALDRCARLTGEDAHVLNFNGQIIFALQHVISDDNEWLVEVKDPDAQ